MDGLGSTRAGKVKRLSVVLAVLSVGLLSLFVIVNGLTLDGLDGFLWSLLSDEDTVYAPGYSDRSFRQVQIGMTAGEVLTRLGEPISRYHLTGQPLNDWSRSFPIESVCWQYSCSPSDSNFRMRYVYVKNGKVVGKRTGYWVD